MKPIGTLIVLLWMSVQLPSTLSMALTNKTGDTCPILKTDGPQLRQIYTDHLKITGFDLAERFSLRQTSCGGEKLCFKLGGATLTKETQHVFPGALPEEYSVVATFRVRRNTKKERWHFWQTTGQNGRPQVSIIVDGAKKVVEFIATDEHGTLLHYTFKSRELHPLFDRQWHKLGLSVQSRIISLYMDCNLVERRQSDKKELIDIKGKTTIATQVSDGKPVDIELRRMTVYCNPKLAAQETCCELAEGLCPPDESFRSTASSSIPALGSKMYAYLSADHDPREKCQCLANKGDQGLPGLAGLPGFKGDMGEKNDSRPKWPQGDI